MGNAYRVPKEVTILDAKAATGWGSNISVVDYRHVMITVASAGTANLTVKCAGSIISPEDVDFTSAAAVDNEWDYVLMYNYQDATSVAGDTGVSFAGADDCQTFIVNVEGLKSLNFQVSARAAGSVTVKMLAVNNQ